MSLKFNVLGLLFFLIIDFGRVQAGEINLPYNKLTLNARLELAANKSFADGVILITHGGLAHRDMELIVYLQQLLKDNGYNTLAINLSLGLDNRHGMFDCKLTHRHSNIDAAAEIGAWSNWLKSQGVSRLVLLGHSRGGAQTALYAAEHNSDLLQTVILMAPATYAETDAATYQLRYNSALAPLLKRAEKLISEHKGNHIIEHANLLNCTNTPVTAESFVSYYGPKAQVDTPSLIPKIRKPILVIVAGSDTVVPNLDTKMARLVDGKQVQMGIVENADHNFRDLSTDTAVDMIIGFLINLNAL